MPVSVCRRALSWCDVAVPGIVRLLRPVAHDSAGEISSLRCGALCVQACTAFHAARFEKEIVNYRGNFVFVTTVSALSMKQLPGMAVSRRHL